MVCDIQDNLGKTINKEDDIEKCIHEAHETESMIEHQKCWEYKGTLVTIRSTVLSSREGLKAMAVASSKMRAGLSHSHGEI